VREVRTIPFPVLHHMMHRISGFVSLLLVFVLFQADHFSFGVKTKTSLSIVMQNGKCVLAIVFRSWSSALLFSKEIKLLEKDGSGGF